MALARPGYAAVSFRRKFAFKPVSDDEPITLPMPKPGNESQRKRQPVRRKPVRQVSAAQPVPPEQPTAAQRPETPCPNCRPVHREIPCGTI